MRCPERELPCPAPGWCSLGGACDAAWRTPEPRRGPSWLEPDTSVGPPEHEGNS